MRIPFFGGFKKSRSVSFNAQRTVNLMVELDQSAKNVLGMFMTPGNTLFSALATGGIRGMWALDSFLYAVGGAVLYKVDTGGNATALGNVGPGTGPVSMEDNGAQLALMDAGLGFIYNTSTGVFGAITDPDFGGGSIVQYFDSYFIVGPQGRQSFQISANGDGTNWVSSDIAPAEGRPDSLVSPLVANRQLWLFGDYSTEVFWNSGNADFPFERFDGGFMEMGTAAKYSPAKGDNTVFWLTKNHDGQGQVARANGYTPMIISSRALEYEFSTYERIDDAIGWVYQQAGHTFYNLTFPTAGKSWSYDVAVQDPELAWHERSSYGLGRNVANCHAFFNGKHYVGDYRNGNIYELRNDVYAENDQPIVWERTGQYVSDDGMPIAFSRFELDCETGVGLAAGQGSDPQIALDWSDDGGKTYGNKLFRSMGKIGANRTRVEWRKLGSSKGKGRVLRVSGSDPVKTALFNAICEMGR